MHGSHVVANNNTAIMERACPKCNTPSLDRPSPDPTHHWLRHFTCGNCRFQWSSCFCCADTVFCLFRPSDNRYQKQVYKRKTKYHAESASHIQTASSATIAGVAHQDEEITAVDEGRRAEETTAPIVPMPDDDDDDGGVFLGDDEDDNRLPRHHRPMDFTNPEHTAHLGSAQSISFYSHASISPANALEYLVKMAIFEGNLRGTLGEPGSISEDEVELHIKVGSISAELSPRLQEMLCDILVSTHKMYTRWHSELQGGGSDDDESVMAPSRPRHRTRLPESKAEFRSFYVEGPHALLPNLPGPLVRHNPDVLNGDATIRLTDALAYALAMGKASIALFDDSNVYGSDYDGDVSNLYQTKRIRELWDEVLMEDKLAGVQMVVIQLWQDGAEFNTTKRNRSSSGFVGTGYILPPPPETNVERNTLLLCLGNSDALHEPFQIEIEEDLSELGSKIHYFYDGKTGTRRPIIIKLHSDLTDRPARSTLTGVGGNAGAYTLAWGHRVNIKQNRNALVSCEDCHKNLLLGNDNGGCDKCCNWNLQDGRMSSTVSSKYPTHDVEGFVVQEDPDDQDSRRYALPALVDYEDMTVAYKACRDNFSSNFWNKTEVKEVGKVAGLSESVVNQAMVDSAADPLPRAVWTRGLPLRYYPNLPMHKECLGNTKTVARTQCDTLSSVKLFSKFVPTMRRRIQLVADAKLAGCMALDPGVSGKMGGYVSENYLAIALMGPWLYGDVSQLLLSKGFSNVDAASQLMPSFFGYLSRAMQKVVTPTLPDDTVRYAKLFLNYLDSVDRTLKKIPSTWNTDEDNEALDQEVLQVELLGEALQGQAPAQAPARRERKKQLLIEKRGNLTATLSTGGELALYGSIRRCLWDGDFRAEAGLRRVKTVAPSANHKSWPRHSARRCYQFETISSLEPRRVPEPRKYRHHETFSSLETARKSLQDKRLVTGIAHGGNDQLFVEVRREENRKESNYHELLFCDNDAANTTTVAGCYYSPVEIATSHSQLNIANDKDQEHFYLFPYDFLPPLALPSFWLRTTEHRVRHSNGDLPIYNMPGAV